MIPRRFAWVLTGVVAFALTGCVGGIPAPDFEYVPMGTVVATGDFGASGPVRGSLKLVKTASDYQLQLIDFAGPAGDELRISARETSPGCYDSWGLGFGDPSTWTAPDIPNKIIGLHLKLLVEPDGSHPDLVDPTFFTTVVVTAPHASDACALTTVGVAHLAWSIGPLRKPPHVVDSGPTAGATSVVTNGTDGSPSRYLIAPGDTLAHISRRFEITLDDLYYLNPTRLTTMSTQIDAGDELNLSASARGS